MVNLAQIARICLRRVAGAARMPSEAIELLQRGRERTGSFRFNSGHFEPHQSTVVTGPLADGFLKVSSMR